MAQNIGNDGAFLRGPQSVVVDQMGGGSSENGARFSSRRTRSQDVTALLDRVKGKELGGDAGRVATIRRVARSVAVDAGKAVVYGLRDVAIATFCGKAVDVANQAIGGVLNLPYIQTAGKPTADLLTKVGVTEAAKVVAVANGPRGVVKAAHNAVDAYYGRPDADQREEAGQKLLELVADEQMISKKVMTAALAQHRYDLRDSDRISLALDQGEQVFNDVAEEVVDRTSAEQAAANHGGAGSRPDPLA